MPGTGRSGGRDKRDERDERDERDRLDGLDRRDGRDERAVRGPSAANAAEAVAPRIALVHATALAIGPVNDAFERLWPAAQRMNLLDDALSSDRARDGRLTEAMTQRFIALARYAQAAGARGVLYTCSAFGPAIEAARDSTRVPTLKPNEAMFEQALAADAAVALVATFEPSIDAMREEYAELCKRSGRRPELVTRHVPGAMEALARGDARAHDEAIAACVSTLDGCEVVMLAQFSMARAAAAAQAATRARVLTSPDCAVLAMRDAIAAVRA